MEEILAIITQGYESRTVDYKQHMIWDESNKKQCCELVKDILALANTDGGWIVIGVSETKSGFSHDGVTQTESLSFEVTRVNQFVNNYAEPPINTVIHKPTLGDKQYIVIEIPQFSESVHICQKDYPGVLQTSAIYVRTANNQSAQITKSSDVRSIIEKSVKMRLEQYASTMHETQNDGSNIHVNMFESQIRECINRSVELNSHEGKAYAYRETIFYPSEFDSVRFNSQALWEMAENASVDFKGWPFIFLSRNRKDLTYSVNDGIETLDSEQHPFSGGDVLHYWWLRESGLLYTRELLLEDTAVSAMPDPKEYILCFEFLPVLCIEAIHCLVRLYENYIDNTDEITLFFRISGIKDRQLGTLDSRRYLRKGFVCKIDEITYKKSLRLADWQVDIVSHALEICKHVFQKFNWQDPNLGECRSIMEKLLSRKL